MVREVIILSDLDLRILRFLEEEKFIKELFYEFEIEYKMLKVHLDRLRKIKCIDTKSFGTFKIVKINKKGKDILTIFKYGL